MFGLSFSWTQSNVSTYLETIMNEMKVRSHCTQLMSDIETHTIIFTLWKNEKRTKAYAILLCLTLITPICLDVIDTPCSWTHILYIFYVHKHKFLFLLAFHIKHLVWWPIWPWGQFTFWSWGGLNPPPWHYLHLHQAASPQYIYRPHSELQVRELPDRPRWLCSCLRQLPDLVFLLGSWRLRFLACSTVWNIWSDKSYFFVGAVLDISLYANFVSCSQLTLEAVKNPSQPRWC